MSTMKRWRDEEINRTKFGFVGIFNDFNIAFDIAHEVRVLFTDHFRDCAAVYDFGAVILNDLQIVHFFSFLVPVENGYRNPCKSA
jgi:hypothetical protein